MHEDARFGLQPPKPLFGKGVDEVQRDKWYLKKGQGKQPRSLGLRLAYKLLTSQQDPIPNPFPTP